MRKQWSSVLLLILVLFIAIFSVLNVDPVDINFGFSLVEIPLVIVIIGSLLIGMLIAAILSTSIIVSERNEKKQLRKDFDKHEQELNAEKEKLNDQHHNELQILKDENEKKEAEIRQLNRRIQNMNVSQTK